MRALPGGENAPAALLEILRSSTRLILERTQRETADHIEPTAEVREEPVAAGTACQLILVAVMEDRGVGTSRLEEEIAVESRSGAFAPEIADSAKRKDPLTTSVNGSDEWALRGSNPRPRGCDPRALTS